MEVRDGAGYLKLVSGFRGYEISSNIIRQQILSTASLRLQTAIGLYSYLIHRRSMRTLPRQSTVQTTFTYGMWNIDTIERDYTRGQGRSPVIGTAATFLPDVTLMSAHSLHTFAQNWTLNIQTYLQLMSMTLWMRQQVCKGVRRRWSSIGSLMCEGYALSLTPAHS